ncbi:MAG: hypothetical protein AB1671_12755 [Thermodesulfobacteriota bacterium]|jgi:putative ABC transport system permease protein
MTGKKKAVLDILAGCFGVGVTPLPILPPSRAEFGYLALALAGGALTGLIPAVRAYRQALVDGLTVRV